MTKTDLFVSCNTSEIDETCKTAASESARRVFNSPVKKLLELIIR